MDLTNNTYGELWAKVEAFEKQQLPKSAYEIVEEIYQKAKEEKVDDQLIKSIIYKVKLSSQFKDNDPADYILEFEKEEKEIKSHVGKSILQSMLGELFHQYGMRNMGRFQNRSSSLDNKEQTDLSLMSLKEIQSRAYDYYMSSIKDCPDENIKEVSAIVEKATDERYFIKAKTIKQFLMLRAMLHFSNSQSIVALPVGSFSLDNTDFFGEDSDFRSLEIPERDVVDFKLEAIKLFQEIANSNDFSTDQKFQFQLKRLEYVRSFSEVHKKEELYKNALIEIVNSGIKLPELQMAYVKLIEFYLQKAESNTVKEDGVDINYFQEVFRWIQKSKNNFTKGIYDDVVAKQRQRLNEITLKISTENVVVPNKDFLANVNYRNAKRAYFRLFKLSEKDRDDYNQLRRQDDKLNYLLGKNIHREWQVELPQADDFEFHNIEIPIDGVSNGFYLLLSSNNASFAYNENDLDLISEFQASNLSYIHQNRESGLEGYILDRNEGYGVSNATVEIYKSRYDQKSRQSLWEVIDVVQSDKSGYFRYSKQQGNFSIKVIKDKDVLDLRVTHYNYNNGNQSERKTVRLFTDRAIYRPGQLIYFKGLAINVDSKQLPSILKSKKVEVKFMDVNWQEVSSQSFTTNEYGTFSGTLVAPSSGLTGQFSIVASLENGQGQTSVSIEEYKRPKFYIEFNKLKDSPKLGDSVTVNGSVIAYSGVKMSETTIKYYVVKRQNYYYFPGMRFWPRHYNRAEEIIKRGEVTTNESGEFSIDFITEKPFSSSQSFRYEVRLDATDVTGQSATDSKSIVLGSQPFNFTTDLPQNIFESDLKEASIQVLNAEGENIKASTDVKIYSLATPEKALKTKYWAYPDIDFLNETEFKKRFPNESFGDESNPESWEIEKLLDTQTIDTTDQKIDISKLENGAYLFKFFVTDSNGASNEFKRYLNVSGKDKVAITTDYIWHSLVNSKYSPGDILNIDFNVPYKNFNVYYRIARGGVVVDKGWFTKRKQSINYSISELDRGNLNVEFVYVKHNRFHSKSFDVNVPWANKDLQIEINKFRNRIEPGSHENWVIKVKNHLNKNVTSEVLASMYDKSLDQFKPHHWTAAFFPNNYPSFSYKGVGFGTSYALQLKRYNRNHYQTQYSDYSPLLNWFGFYLPYRSTGNYGGRIMKDSRIMKRSAEPMMSQAVPMEGMQDEMIEMESSGVSADAVSSPEESNAPGDSDEKSDDKNNSIRENLNETVFFYPDLITDENGEAALSFTMNEALTKWKLQVLALTSQLEYGFKTFEVETFKDLIVEPNLPRFLRQGDQIMLNAKVSNLGQEILNTNVRIKLISHSRKIDVTNSFLANVESKNLLLEGGESKIVSWEIVVPDDFSDLLDIEIVADSGSLSDGELNQIPILSNRILVTESMVMHVGALENEVFKFEAMNKLDRSQTLENYKYKIEFYNNPSWLVLKSLPSMINEEALVTTQLFDSFYALSLGYDLVSKDNTIKEMIQLWIAKEEKGMLSKNESVKLSKLNETPWVREAILENENIRMLSKFIDDNSMKQRITSIVRKLEQRIQSNGGFTWTPGGRDNWFVTQYILEGYTRLKSLGVDVSMFSLHLLENAINYVDQSLIDHYNKRRDKKLFLSPLIIQYLYVRPQFHRRPVHNDLRKVVEEYQELARQRWTKMDSYQQAMIAYGFVMHDQQQVANSILQSLKQRIVKDEELGYYLNDQAGYYWYNNAIDKQAFIIDLFNEMDQDQIWIDGLKLWLLKNKQVNSWKTTRETASAVYAFMKDSENWLSSEAFVSIELPLKNEKIEFNRNTSSGGYVSKSWSYNEVGKNLSEVKVFNPNKHVSWGASYWQYFEDMDAVESFKGTPLILNKTLSKVAASDEGDILIPLNETSLMKPGDRLRVKIELNVDRPMEFVQMKDLRGSGLEPINVLSQYKWQDGLGYYESTKDVATYFYFDYLPKGNFVFEYDVFVVHKGEYSNGNCSIQSFYAPEFTSHSQGERLKVE